MPTLHMGNVCYQRARAVESTQVKAADHGLLLQPFDILLLAGLAAKQVS
jgi:hypothetical protein